MTKDNTPDENNVIRIVRAENPANDVPQVDEGIPTNTYRIVNIQNEEQIATGFLLFTSQHVAVMRDDGKGAIPVLVLPLNMCKFAELMPDQPELPW